MRKHLNQTLSNQVPYKTIIWLVYCRVSKPSDIVKAIFFPEALLIYIPQQLLLVFVLYKVVVGKAVSMVLLTCWKSGFMSVLLEFLLLITFLCVSLDAMSQPVTKTTVGCGLIQSHRERKSRLEVCIWQRWETLVLHRYRFYFPARFLLLSHVV